MGVRTIHKKTREWIVPGSRNRECKGPEAALSFACGRNRMVARVAGAERAERVGRPSWRGRQRLVLWISWAW